MPEQLDNEENVLEEASPADRVNAPDWGDIDLSLLQECLAKTPWECMQANDDALSFAGALRVAMENQNAKSWQTDAEIDVVAGRVCLNRRIRGRGTWRNSGHPRRGYFKEIKHQQSQT
jgi:hypothetical protein